MFPDIPQNEKERVLEFMKATGIVRRIDDLGRVVIPKEIRRTMRIREGDPLEIYTSRDGEVIFKKYSLLGGMEDFATQLCETMSRSTGSICAVTDRDTVIAVAGGGKREALWHGQPRRSGGAGAEQSRCGGCPWRYQHKYFKSMKKVLDKLNVR